MALDPRERDLDGPDALRAAFEAKALAELDDANAILGAGPGAWEGRTVGARIALVVGGPARSTPACLLLDERTSEAVMKAAAALGAADGVFVLATRPVPESAADARARRVRLALEAVDAPAVIALDPDGAADLAAAFCLDGLKPGRPVRAFGRSLGFAGDFAASLDDPAAKAAVWSAMKAIAALGGLEAKGRPKAPRTDSV